MIRDHDHIIILLGPTAVGKTAVSIPLAKSMDAEIISADSRQVYISLDIGTAKPSITERDGIPHHLIDIVQPQDNFTVADFQKLAFDTIQEIHSRKKAVLIVGGTGLYIRALIDKPSYQDQPPIPELRDAILDEIEKRGALAVYDELAEFDPETAAKIHPNNIPRLVRAVEVIRSTGRKFSEAVRADSENREESKYRWHLIGLNMDRELLYERINRRVRMMIDAGWIDEVTSLLESGLTGNEKSLAGLGYRDMVAAIRGEISLDDAIEKIKRDTRRFAKRQMTYFRGMEGVKWMELSMDSNPVTIAEQILRVSNKKKDMK